MRLKGVLDYGGRQPSIAVLELPGEGKTKSFQAGERIGQSGAVLIEIGAIVIVEYDQRRYKLTYKGAQELPAAPVGDNR